MIELAKQFKNKFIFLGENTEKFKIFTVLIKKEVVKNGEKITKNIFYHVHYQILQIIFLKEFIELNLNLDTETQNLKHMVLNATIETSFLNTPVLKVI